MTFKSLQEAHAPEVFALLRTVYAAPEFPLGGAWTERLLETELGAGHGLGLFEESRLVAFVLYRQQTQAWDISILATDLSQRRKGTMTCLITELLKRRPQGTEIWLEVHEGNTAAVNLYKKLGFRQVGTRPGYYRDGRSALLFSYR